MGAVMLYAGQPTESLEWYDKVLEFDPYLSPGVYMNIGIAHYLKGDEDKAILWLKQAATKWPTFLGCHILLASIYGQSGQMDLAEAEKAKILSISPFFKLDFYGQAYQNPAHREKIVAGLRKAGLT
jgi:tetratricopeptide (TPR) repeat protein